MCGIVGYFNRRGQPIADTSTILKMKEVQKHRGPNDSGINLISFADRKSTPFPVDQPQAVAGSYVAALGFNRLSILDLSLNGHQPMSDPDGSVALVFNGEIYNAFDYRGQLEAEGYTFKSATDTEVIIALYLKHGFDRMVRMLNGMFALVLVDLERRTSYLARDRFGIKPLYVFESPERTAFSSEVKSFGCLPECRFELNLPAVDEYMLFRNNLDTSLLKCVDQVKPGTYRMLTTETSNEIRYHDFNDCTRSQAEMSFADGKALFADVLETSTQRQMISDVKLGCQLSGGIDSSLVTLYAYKHCREQLESVSILLEDEAYSEARYIDQVVKSIPLVSHRFVLEEDFFLRCFDRALWHFEFPIGHPNSLGIYLLAQEARKHVTVLLSGEGADELLGGYPRFGALPEAFYLRGFLSGLVDQWRHPVRHITRYLNDMNPSLHCIMGGSFMNREVARELKRDFSFRRATASRMRLFKSLRGGYFDRRIKYELMTYLPDLLMRQDKMTMAHSIENRVPFLDNHVLTAAFSLPERHLLKQDGDKIETKATLKSLAADHFGKEFAYSPKRGFSIPLLSFFSNPGFLALIHDDLLPGMESDDLFNARVVREWIKHREQMSHRQVEALWVLLSFQAWKRTYKVA